MLLSIGKENPLCLGEKARHPRRGRSCCLCFTRPQAGQNIHGTVSPGRAKIEPTSTATVCLPSTSPAGGEQQFQMTIATHPRRSASEKGEPSWLARIIPLVIEQEKMEAMQAAAGPNSILERAALPTRRSLPLSTPPAARCSRAVLRTSLLPSSSKSWRCMAVRWPSTRSATMTRRASRPPFWKQRPQAVFRPTTGGMSVDPTTAISRWPSGTLGP